MENCQKLQHDLDNGKIRSLKWLLEFNSSKYKVVTLDKETRKPDTCNTMTIELNTTLNLSPEAHINRISSAAYVKLANVITAFRTLNKEFIIFIDYVGSIEGCATPLRSLFTQRRRDYRRFQRRHDYRIQNTQGEQTEQTIYHETNYKMSHKDILSVRIVNKQ